MSPHFVTIKHPSKSGKLNEVGKIFLDLFDLNTYTLTTMISCMIDDVESIQYFQNNGFEPMGVFFLLFDLDIKFKAFNQLFSPKHANDHHHK